MSRPTRSLMGFAATEIDAVVICGVFQCLGDLGDSGFVAASVQKAAENILLKRMGSPEEVADAVVFLASDAASYITAQTLNVNGGLYF